MGLSGKLIGAGLGYFMGGPFGAVIGGIIGHYVKDAPLGGEDRVPEDDPRVRQQQRELHFVASLVGILTTMIQADGELKQEEVRAVRTFFSDRLGYRGESLEIVRGLIKEFLRTGVNLDAVCRDVAAHADYPTRLLLVECLLDIAMADGHLHPAEKTIFERCVSLLGIAASDVAGLVSRGRGGGNGGDYATLGVGETAGEAEVKRAYREMVKKYHPDRVTHLGEEFRELAHGKFLEVQTAYDRIRSARGWS